MYEKLTIYELKKYYEENRPSVIYFLTSDQDWCTEADSLKLKIAFNQILIIQDPMVVCLTNGMAQLCVNQIREIHIDHISKKYPSLGDILSITSIGRDGNDITYQFLVS